MSANLQQIKTSAYLDEDGILRWKYNGQVASDEALEIFFKADAAAIAKSQAVRQQEMPLFEPNPAYRRR